MGTKHFSWHSQQSRSFRYVFGIGAFVTASILCWFTYRSRDWFPFFIGLLFVITVPGLLVELDTYVDTDAKTLCREARLFGSVRLWKHCRSLTDFRAIRLKMYRDDDGNNNTLVELLRHSGRPVAVKCFYGAECSEAPAVADTLARTTGIPLDEPPPTG